MVVLNRAMILTVAFLLTGEKKYKVMAQRQMDYILGENANMAVLKESTEDK